uniref:Uncharacterized protein n=1 Tax=Tanacetum cinerariifolium TaxID=118510 RepID=A0A6L2NSG5_TANCI|nr:hypothetical protein [Tanacetum cinerariifolium]
MIELVILSTWQPLIGEPPGISDPRTCHSNHRLVPPADTCQLEDGQPLLEPSSQPTMVNDGEPPVNHREPPLYHHSIAAGPPSVNYHRTTGQRWSKTGLVGSGQVKEWAGSGSGLDRVGFPRGTT